MKIVNLNNVKKFKVEMEGTRNAYKQVPVSGRDGSPTCSFRIFTVEPGGYTPKHAHPYEHVNYIIQGKGSLFSEQNGEQPLQTGDFALVLPNELHQYKNSSPDEPFVMICAVPKEFE